MHIKKPGTLIKNARDETVPIGLLAFINSLTDSGKRD